MQNGGSDDIGQEKWGLYGDIGVVEGEEVE